MMMSGAKDKFNNMGNDLISYTEGEMDWNTLVDTVKSDWTKQKGSGEE